MRKRSHHSKKDYELDFDTHAEIRQAFSYLDDLAPPSPDLPPPIRIAPFERRHKVRQRAIYTAAASVAAVALAGGAIVTNTYESITKTADLTSTQDTASSAPIQNQSFPEPILDSEYTNIHRDSFGELWGIRSEFDSPRPIGRSTDGGETWSIVFAPEPNEKWRVLDVSPDDEVRVATITTPRDDNDFSKPGDIKLRTFDRTNGTWSTETLPALDVPADAQAIPDGGDDECGLGGLHNIVTPFDIVSDGDTVLVLGQQSILAQGSCDVTTNVLWTSTGGSWDVGPIDLPGGYASGLSFFEGSFIAYGSSEPGHIYPDREFRLWSSPDGSIWERQALDLPELPPFAVTPGGDDSPRTGKWQPIEAVESDDGLVLWVAVGVLPAIDESIKDSAELKEILDATGIDETRSKISLTQIEETLEFVDIDFPLDTDEVEHLHYLFRDQPAGHLVLTNDADRGWVGELRE